MNSNRILAQCDAGDEPSFPLFNVQALAEPRLRFSANLLLLELWKGGKLWNPALLRSRPELNLRNEFVALSDGTGTQAVHFWSIFGGG